MNEIEELKDAIYGLGTRLAVDDDTVGKGLHDIARALDRVADAIIHASNPDYGVEPYDPIYGGRPVDR